MKLTKIQCTINQGKQVWSASDKTGKSTHTLASSRPRSLTGVPNLVDLDELGVPGREVVGGGGKKKFPKMLRATEGEQGPFFFAGGQNHSAGVREMVSGRGSRGKMKKKNFSDLRERGS